MYTTRTKTFFDGMSRAIEALREKDAKVVVICSDEEALNFVRVEFLRTAGLDIASVNMDLATHTNGGYVLFMCIGHGVGSYGPWTHVWLALPRKYLALVEAIDDIRLGQPGTGNAAVVWSSETQA